jgi:hypothetical protein
MKLSNPKPLIRTSAIAFSLMLGLMLVSPLGYSAGRGGKEPVQSAAFENVIEGPFDGLSLEEQRIWIDDTVYLLDRNVKVKGTSKKLGLITDLKKGEWVRATLRQNSDPAKKPYVIMIER